MLRVPILKLGSEAIGVGDGEWKLTHLLPILLTVLHRPGLPGMGRPGLQATSGGQVYLYQVDLASEPFAAVSQVNGLESGVSNGGLKGRGGESVFVLSSSLSSSRMVENW